MTSFRVEQETTTFTTLGGPAPDPKWAFTDRQGHRHVAGTRSERWPTLRWVVDKTYWCDLCRDEHQEGHYECRECGQAIEPGMIHKGPETVTVPTLRHYFIDDVEVSEEEARRRFEIESGGERK